MPYNEETRRTVKCGRASKMSLGGDISEDTVSPVICNQAAWLAARFNMGAAHARVIAEHAFQNGGAA